MNERIGFTRELRDWVLHNVDRGVPPGPLARTLAEQGFDGEAATAVVETLWSARARGVALPEDGIDAEEVQAARYRYEEPRLPTGISIDVGDRRVRVALRLERPMVAVLDGVFSPEECDALIALTQPRLQPSTLVDPASGQDVTSAKRTSQGLFFRPQENALIDRIDRRLARLMGLPLANGEGLQVLHYAAEGAQSAPHFDFLLPTNSANQASISRSGQRVSTLVAYLNDPEEGGETVFPEAGISVAPRKGSALYFEYCNSAGQLDPLSLHAALPVLAGEKWVATRWMRQRAFRTA
ncbi:2OG-Fe(II) oxygenase [Ramlibacter sp.]|uniref:2OG-Fe(II) oxygenase n=1 Tax=Ramlibacter sp. TaxID=1917967 RepID=UPI00260506F8|nr:2OG-Fe(II) oxygenase [Ramlibacter sp.]MDB5955303.1 Procollagen-proline dioxygenase [Ramlibacter sp.]